jgi:3',5'-cyclic AMP phosphodiesterase CpdA
MLPARFGLLAVLILLSSIPCNGEPARGVVFEDRNGNGVRDAGESGVAGVSVSNGVQVVQTDGQGGYLLDVQHGTILFITKPTGYRVPLDENNLPRHYYIHDPEGTSRSLELRYPGVEPTGPLPASVDFPLRRVEEPARFNVVWFADPQPQKPVEIDYIRDDVVAELVGVDAAFGITVGDIMYDKLSLFPRYNRIVAQIGIPWYNVPGNHDLNYRAESNEFARETFKRYFGPPYYSFDYGNVHFVVLDDVHYMGRNKSTKSGGSSSKPVYEGRIGGDQLAWLINDLRFVPPDRLVVVAMHIPLRAAMDPLGRSRNVRDRAGFFEALKGRENLFLVAGHMHTAEHHYFNEKDGWEGDSPLHQHVIAAVSGSWWSGPRDDRGIPVSWQRDGTPNGYYVMSVDGDRATMRFKAASEPVDYQMRIELVPEEEREPRKSDRDSRARPSRLVVNLFDGGPRSTVEYRIGTGPWVRMARQRREDPFIEEHFARFEKTIKSWVDVEPSTHVWTKILPDDLQPGPNTLTIRAVDEYGAEHVAHKVFEVVGQR